MKNITIITSAVFFCFLSQPTSLMAEEVGEKAVINLKKVQRSGEHPIRKDSLEVESSRSNQPLGKQGIAGSSRYPTAGTKAGLDELNQRSAGTMFTEKEHSLLHKILFYLPNRVLDAWDIFRGDLGVGSSGGVVIRASRYGQLGYRYVEPLSLRLGPQGRRFPFFAEREDESGVGLNFDQSSNRYVTPYEVGLGLDLFVVGAYAGISFDEVWDFITGWVMIDPEMDDL